MPVTATDWTAPGLSYRMIVESDVGATPVQAIVSGPCNIISIEISGNSAQLGHLKLCDSLTATAGTTVPKLIIYCRVNTAVAITIPGDGLPFDNGLSFYWSDAPGVTGSSYSDDGSQAVLVKITTS